MRKAILPFVLLIFSGCMATQNDMLLLQSQIDDLNANLSNMQKNQADLSVKIDNLNASLNASSENMKDLSSDINKLSAKIDDYGNLTDKKINVIGQSVKKQQEDMERSLMPAKLYAQGMSSYSSRNYAEAVENFKNYIAKYPDAENMDNAYFYLAESLYEKKNYKEAAIFYARILEKYPGHARTPTVRFKYATCLLALKEPAKKDEALRYLKSVVKDYPGSLEAKAAREFFKKEEKKPASKKTR